MLSVRTSYVRVNVPASLVALQEYNEFESIDTGKPEDNGLASRGVNMSLSIPVDFLNRLFCASNGDFTVLPFISFV